MSNVEEPIIPEDPYADVDAEVEVTTEPELPPLPQSTDQLVSLQEEKAAAEAQPEDEKPHIEHRDVKWHTVDELPGSVTLNLARLKDPNVPDGQKATIIHDVIFYTIVLEERAEFGDWLNTAVPTIKIDELMEILQKLVEKVINRPTE